MQSSLSPWIPTVQCEFSVSVFMFLASEIAHTFRRKQMTETTGQPNVQRDDDLCRELEMPQKGCVNRSRYAVFP